MNGFDYERYLRVVTIQTCGSSTSLNNTYWQNSGFSSAYTTAGQCSLFVSRASSDVDQLRYSFNVAKLLHLEC